MSKLVDLQQKYHAFHKAQTLPANPTGLYQPIKYLLESGKQLRPLLLLATHQMFKHNWDQALKAAYGLEVFHNFTLMHDDIMDEATMRRGKQAVHAKYGLNAAILSGDAMLIYAYRNFLSIDHPQKVKLMNLFTGLAEDICEGQQRDMDLENKLNPEADEYILMIKQKTAVLLETAARMGSILGEASDESEEHTAVWALNLGIAFQIQDDILDAYGSEKSGKQRGGDIIQNKKTLLYIEALKRSETNVQERLEELFSTTPEHPNDKIEEVLEIFTASGATESVKAFKERYEQTSKMALESISVDETKKSLAKQLHEAIANREY